MQVFRTYIFNKKKLILKILLYPGRTTPAFKFCSFFFWNADFNFIFMNRTHQCMFDKLLNHCILSITHFNTISYA